MTTNREMLEFAAKACGIDLTFDYDDATTGLPYARSLHGGARFWNPIDNAADCFAMCAKLKIDTLWTDDCVVCGDDSRTYESEIPLDDNPEAAWRYAATMVAAKIGGMK